jgi:hypothetical protein
MPSVDIGLIAFVFDPVNGVPVTHEITLFINGSPSRSSQGRTDGVFRSHGTLPSARGSR